MIKILIIIQLNSDIRLPQEINHLYSYIKSSQKQIMLKNML